MNRIDRLFAIVLLLQQQRLVRGEQIAKRFEVGIRTVYRDVAALIESGVPIVTVPGRGYELMAGYTLPPLAFYPDEAVALVLGIKMLQQHTQGKTQKQLTSALERLLVAIPKETRAHTQLLTQNIDFFAPSERFDLEHRDFQVWSHAIQERKVVQFGYRAWQQNARTERLLEPQQLTYHNGVWYVSGHCRLRQAWRSFHFSRIENPVVLGETFVAITKTATPIQYVTVRLKVHSEHLAWLMQRQHHGFVSQQSNQHTSILTYQVQRLEEIVPWILGWGTMIQILEPAELRQHLRQTLQIMISQLT
jgi:predicted DNA-binding transcriptional regulator YafY